MKISKKVICKEISFFVLVSWLLNGCLTLQKTECRKDVDPRPGAMCRVLVIPVPGAGDFTNGWAAVHGLNELRKAMQDHEAKSIEIVE